MASSGSGWSFFRRHPVLGPMLLVFLLCLATQFVVVLQYWEDPFSGALVSDALSYDLWAQRIAADGMDREPVFHQAPLYPVALSGIYRVVGVAHRWTAVLALQSILTAAAIALLVPLGRVYSVPSLPGAVVALLYGPFAFYSLKVLPVSVCLLSQAIALVALGWARIRVGPLSSWLAGATLGMAALARAEILLFAPIAAAATAWPQRPALAPARRAGLAAMFLAGVAAGIAPATIHNVRRGDLVLVASSGGENFYIGNKSGAKGDYTPLHPQAGDIFSERELARQVAERESGRSLRPSEVSAFWARKAVEEIVADPGRWILLEARKLLRILHPGDPTDIYSFPLERGLYLPALHALPLPSWVLLASGAIGVVLALRRQATQSWPLVAFVATQVLVLMIFFVNSRLRLPLLFSLAPFAGFTAEATTRMWKDRKRRLTAALVTGSFVVLGALGAYWTAPHPRDRVRLASVLSAQNRLDEGLRVLEPALSESPPYGLALDQAGWLLQKKGDWSAARERYRAALAAGLPEGRAYQTRTRLAITLERLGDLSGAGEEHDRAVSEAGANAGTYYERGMFLLRMGSRDAAVRDLEEARRRDPSWDAPRAALRELGPG